MRTYPRSIVDGHVTLEGKRGLRLVYSFQDTHKHWVAPCYTQLIDNYDKRRKRTFLYAVVNYPNPNGGKRIRLNACLGDIEKIDYSRILEKIRDKLLPFYERYGCFKSYPPSGRVMRVDRYRDTDFVYFRITPKRVDDQPINAMVYRGHYSGKTLSGFREVYRRIQAEGRENVRYNLERSRLPLEEAFEFTDVCPGIIMYNGGKDGRYV